MHPRGCVCAGCLLCVFELFVAVWAHHGHACKNRAKGGGWGFRPRGIRWCHQIVQIPYAQYGMPRTTSFLTPFCPRGGADTLGTMLRFGQEKALALLFPAPLGSHSGLTILHDSTLAPTLYCGGARGVGGSGWCKACTRGMAWGRAWEKGLKHVGGAGTAT